MAAKKELSSLSVLVVDDVFKMRNLIKGMLRQMGIREIHEAGDGMEALEVLSRQAVDLILCDWNMPKMKGIDVLNHIRSHKELSNIPFLMITGEMTEDVVAQAADSEVDDYLVKPFTMGQLVDKTKRVVTSYYEVSGIEQHLDKGRAYIATRQFGKAKEEFKAALAINPRSPRTLLAIGKLYEETGNDLQAKTYYHQAVEIAPNFLRGLDALANLYKALGDKDKHIKYLNRAVQISPRNLERKFMLGETLIQAGEKDKAKALFSNILDEATRQYAGVVERVGDVLLELGAWDEAEKAFVKAINSDASSLHAFNQLGMAYRKQGKFGEAITNYKRALAMAPQDENLLYNLGRVYLEWGKFPEAERTLGLALRIRPEFQEASRLMGMIQARKA